MLADQGHPLATGAAPAVVEVPRPGRGREVVVLVVLLVLTGVLALVGRSQIGRAGPPERTLRTTKETVATLKGIKPHAS